MSAAEPIPLADSMCEDFDDLDRCITVHVRRLRAWVREMAPVTFCSDPPDSQEERT